MRCLCCLRCRGSHYHHPDRHRSRLHPAIGGQLLTVHSRAPECRTPKKVNSSRVVGTALLSRSDPTSAESQAGAESVTAAATRAPVTRRLAGPLPMWDEARWLSVMGEECSKASVAGATSTLSEVTHRYFTISSPVVLACRLQTSKALAMPSLEQIFHTCGPLRYS